MSNRGWSRKRLRGQRHSPLRDLRLFIELLEPRCVLSGMPMEYVVLENIAADPVVAELRDSAQTAVRIRLETTSVGDSPLDSVRVGDYFQVKAFVQDLRTAPEKPDGVFAAYLDLLYDPERVRPTESISYGSSYSVARSFDFCAGGIDDVGAASHSIRPLGDREQFLFEIVFQAIADGSADFKAEPADQRGSDILVYNSNFPVPGERVEYVGAQINVRPSAYASAAEDNSPMAADQDLLDRLEAAEASACTPVSAAAADAEKWTKRIPAPPDGLAPQFEQASGGDGSFQLRPTGNANGTDAALFRPVEPSHDAISIRWSSNSSTFITTEFVGRSFVNNEVHSHMLAAGDLEFIELYNVSDGAVDISEFGIDQLFGRHDVALILPAGSGVEGFPVSRSQDIRPRSNVDETVEPVQQTIRSPSSPQVLPPIQRHPKLPLSVLRRSVKEPNEQDGGELLEDGDVFGLAKLPR